MLNDSRVPGQPALMAQQHPLMPGHGILDSEESKNIAVVHKTNQGYSGMDLWKLKHFRPDLFQSSAGAAASGPPVGYREARDRPGFWFNPQQNIYMNRQNNKQYCCDPESDQLCEIHQGDDISNVLVVRGDSSASVGKSGATSKHLSIGDLHRAAASMKLDFAHHDAPAAMFAVYDGGTSSSAAAEAAAKGFHVKLLPRLAAHRGLWQADRLERVLGDSLEELLREVSPEGGAGIGAAVALLLGGRITLAATNGASCMLFGQAGSELGDTDNLDIVGEGSKPRVECAVLEDGHVGVFMTVQGVRSAGMPMGRIRSMARSHITSDRPRAACTYVLSEARKGGADGALVAAAVHLCWQSRAHMAKKLKTDPAALTKVRCRHILIRHAGSQASGGAGAKQKPVKRTLAEAEVAALQLISEIQSGGPAAFTKRCREDSECDTAMRGGDLAGDLGWLDRDPKKNKTKIPAVVVRAAFTLQVGQLSDIVVSERGVHIITRSA